MTQKGFTPIFIILGVLIIIGVVGSVYYFFSSKPLSNNAPTPTVSTTNQTISQEIPSNWKAYINKQYGYKISYPPDYLLDANLPSYLILSIPKNISDPHGEVTSIFRIQAEKYSQNGITKSFRDYVELLKAGCLADYPGKDYCDEIIKNEPYTNSVGSQGFEVHLRQVHESGNPNDKPVYSTKGPIFVFESVNNSAIIYLDSSYGLSSPTDEKLFKQIVDNIVFTK